MEEDRRIDRSEDLVKKKGITFTSDLELFMKKKSQEKEKIDFFCLCGSQEFVPHRQSNGIFGPSGRRWITHYECAGCTTHFGDPKKYSESQRRIKEFIVNLSFNQ